MGRWLPLRRGTTADANVVVGFSLADCARDMCSETALLRCVAACPPSSVFGAWKECSGMGVTLGPRYAPTLYPSVFWSELAWKLPGRLKLVCWKLVGCGRCWKLVCGDGSWKFVCCTEVWKCCGES